MRWPVAYAILEPGAATFWSGMPARRSRCEGRLPRMNAHRPRPTLSRTMAAIATPICRRVRSTVSRGTSARRDHRATGAQLGRRPGAPRFDPEGDQWRRVHPARWSTAARERNEHAHIEGCAVLWLTSASKP